MVHEADLRTVRRLVHEAAALVDVLPDAEYAEEHLRGAISLPLKRLDAASVASLGRGRPVVVYCWDSLIRLTASQLGEAVCHLRTRTLPIHLPLVRDGPG